MAEEKPKLTNEISAETGQFDARFMLWRMFCAEHSVAIESLPSDLKGEIKDKWDKVKDDHLNPPVEQKQ